VRSAFYSLVIIALAFSSMGGDCTLGGGPISLARAPCGERAAPVTFQADPGCGPGGPIVVQGSKMYPQYPTWIDISNSRALGLAPTSGNSSNCAWTSGAYQGAYQGKSFTGDGGVCPIRWDQGTWELKVGEELAPDRTSLKDCDCSLGCAVVTLQTCTAVLANGEGTLTCQPTDGGTPCTSHLTEVQDAGTD
jgi:hypothetical protein